MFENLGDKLQQALKKLTGKGKVSEKDIKEVMREVRLSLLEADVNFKVVRSFIKKVTERAMGAEVMESLTPGQQVIKIVRDELTDLMGSTSSRLVYNTNGTSVYLMVGLQGSGKTTHCAKLALKTKEEGRRPMIAALDVYRPAAIEQLQVLGRQIDVPIFSMGQQTPPADIAKAALAQAQRESRNVLILDTAGRLQIDEALMDELVSIKQAVKPTEILLVVDAMVGQESVNVADAFHQKLGIDGIILTKMDGDTRGGAALSMKEVTGAPIKFIGTGEKISPKTLEEFHPERMASRILGMGDLLSLIERAEKSFDAKKAQDLEKRMRKEGLNYEDFLEQMQQMKEMGSLSEILAMIPGAAQALKGIDIDERNMVKIEAIIRSMTVKERRNPDLLNPSRKERIAKGSGTTLADVNRLVKQFTQTRKMMKQVGNIAKKGRNPFGGIRMPF